MGKVHVFEMNDCDWIAAETLEQARGYYKGIVGEDEEEARQLTEEELGELVFVEGDDRDEGRHISFLQHLEELVSQGQQFPCYFASTEY